MGISDFTCFAARGEAQAGSLKKPRMLLRPSGKLDPCPAAGRQESISDQTLQSVYVALIIAGFIDRSFRDEGCLSGARIVQQALKRLQADPALSDVFMTIDPRGACRFGIVTMPHRDVSQTNRVLQILHRVFKPFARDNVIAGSMHMAGVDTCRYGNNRAKTFYQLCYLLKGATQRVLRACSILD